ncbi:methylated-DNA--[protein]-cysteine S-methyltransferase [Actinomadura sp. HBU206391]|uniref:methylated-DNA--[protein]-cysteine S-methyltransferase n=1 Tax=Actinomadura sp. HBU206391 TaxID=2731692 RepID=UPI0016504A81|nr:methylated-DNA--[protein]-cysteine S-methyltransferase [Actinomadura sp. HBU206391]MBC6461917.1 methylated-DNA--[protein]-cysteine S-methyltransferase [Actinomadura sp. HBU206391]
MARTHTVIASPIGGLTAVAEDGVLCGMYFERHRRGPGPEELGAYDESGFDEVRRQLGEYFADERTRFELALAPRGDEFQQQVWRLLTEIPFGETRSYGDLARRLGNVSLAQAVGAANARNPISVIVPCHRVVAADGGLTGYAGGLDRKRFLLDLEEPAARREARLF